MTDATPQQPERGASAGFVQGLLHWLLPIYTTQAGGQRVLVYTSFPKAFYFYLVWLPGFVVLALERSGVLAGTAVVWWMFGFAVITYLVIAEDTSPMGFALLVLTSITGFLLYQSGWLDWAGAQALASAVKQQEFTQDPATLAVLNTFVFVVWVAVYLFAVTWKKRELSSLRRSKLRPPLGRRPLPIVGRVVDNRVRDVFELVLGFGAYDVEISYSGGKPIDVDKNCVGLGFRLSAFIDIISSIPTREEEVVAAASEDAVEVG